MKQKFILDLKVVSVERLNEKNVLIKLTHDAELPDMKPGQFVEVRVDGSASTYLRRPISINFVVSGVPTPPITLLFLSD